MSEKQRKRRDFIQNMLIALLSVSAVFFFMQTQFYNLGLDAYGGFFTGTGTQMDASVTDQSDGIIAPVRVAVTGPYGRYASVTMTTEDERFDPLGRILGEVLGSARSYDTCGARVYLEVLRGTSVYYDFLNPLPLSVLTELTGIPGEDDAFARALVVAPGDEGVELYIWDGENGYRCYETAVSRESLDAVVNQYEMGNAQFAFDGLGEEDVLSISPYALFLEETPQLPVLSESLPAVEEERLLAALRFNPNTKSRYTEAGGTEVIMENGRALRLQADGDVLYQGGGEETLTVEAGDTPTLQELVVGSTLLMDSLANLAGGDGRLYLTGVQQGTSTITMTYGYQVQGVPVQFSDGSEAGSITLSGTEVSELSLRLRQYVLTEEMSLLLPLRQALAIAEQYDGAELFIGYVGGRSGRTTARWLAE